MSNLEPIKIEPRALEVANAYLATMSIAETASILGLLESDITEYLEQKAVKRYIDNIFLDQGYRNKWKMGALLDKIIESKLEEAEESQVYSKKDLADLLLIAHKIRMEELKAIKDEAPGKQVNIQQNNYGENYGELMKKLLEI